MMKLKLTRREKKVIREVVKIELESLDEILSSQLEIIEACNEHSLDRNIMNDKINQAIGEFKEVDKNPENLLKLDSDNLSIFRHILENHLEQTPQILKRSLWKKLFAWENMSDLYNPN